MWLAPAAVPQPAQHGSPVTPSAIHDNRYFQVKVSLGSLFTFLSGCKQQWESCSGTRGMIALAEATRGSSSSCRASKLNTFKINSTRWNVPVSLPPHKHPSLSCLLGQGCPPSSHAEKGSLHHLPVPQTPPAAGTQRLFDLNPALPPPAVTSFARRSRSVR